MIREDLGINDWLELIKEDKNLNGAYISIAQYIYLTEKENQELKLELSGYRHAILNNKEMLGLKEQNDKLKKQLENTINSYNEEHNLRHIFDLKLDVLETKQKEFINYLEDKINLYKINTQGYSMDLAEEILQKYKSIIGGE